MCPMLGQEAEYEPPNEGIAGSGRVLDDCIAQNPHGGIHRRGWHCSPLFTAAQEIGAFISANIGRQEEED